MSFKASAPGSLMLLGEYAVLENKCAVVCAVNKRMSVILTPRSDKKIFIQSALGHYQTVLSNLKIEAPFKFVLTAIHLLKKNIPSGFELHITSEFSDKIGFASSAAVTVAVLSALLTWMKKKYLRNDLLKLARQVVRKVQGVGSGADIAACIYGGVIQYRAEPLSVQQSLKKIPLTVVYSGNKTPTVDAIAHVKNYFISQKKIYSQLMQVIEDCAVAGFKAIKKNNLAELGRIMSMQQGVMTSLNVSNQPIETIFQHMREEKKILGAKISGSGLGDCVIGLGLTENPKLQKIPVEVTAEGVWCEKI